MAASYENIEQWVLLGVTRGATHVIVVCDTFDWSDYPVYVEAGENVEDVLQKYAGKSIQKVMEVYNLALPIAQQLHEDRAWHV